MTAKFFRSALATAAIALAVLATWTATPAEAQRRDGASVNSSYQAGPRTRVYVTKRSWLDAGTEVLPGERKFSDYAYPPGYSLAEDLVPSIKFRRQPLPDPWDLPGYPKY